MLALAHTSRSRGGVHLSRTRHAGLVCIVEDFVVVVGKVEVIGVVRADTGEDGGGFGGGQCAVEKVETAEFPVEGLLVVVERFSDPVYRSEVVGDGEAGGTSDVGPDTIHVQKEHIRDRLVCRHDQIPISCHGGAHRTRRARPFRHRHRQVVARPAPVELDVVVRVGWIPAG